MKPINIDLYTLKANAKCTLTYPEHWILKGTEILKITVYEYDPGIHICKEHAKILADKIKELLP